MMKPHQPGRWIHGFCQWRMVNYQWLAFSQMKRPPQGKIRADTSLHPARVEKNGHSFAVRAGRRQIEKRVFDVKLT